MKMPGKCTGPQFSFKKFGKMGKAPSGRSSLGQEDGQAGRSSDMVQKVFGICEAKNGTKTNELLQT